MLQREKAYSSLQRRNGVGTYSAKGVRHDPARIEGSLSLQHPETSLELRHFLAATNWLHLQLPVLADVVFPL